MHSDPGLVERLWEALPDILEPKKMFGGQCWMLNGNMCVGIYKEYLIIRIGLEAFEKIKSTPHVYPMDITGKPMKGWAKVALEGLEDDVELERFYQLAIRFVSTLDSK